MTRRGCWISWNRNRRRDGRWSRSFWKDHGRGFGAGYGVVQDNAYDRWRIEDLKHWLVDEGIELPLVAWGQGFKDMAPAVDTFEALVLDAKLHHGGHPVLTWNVSNAVVQVDPAGARKVAKDRSIERVDGLVALIMAIGLHGREPKPMTYDFSGERGITIIRTKTYDNM